MRPILVLFVQLALLVLLAQPAAAIYDPRTVPGNKVGVHILAPSELEKAASLVNTNGGDWGYVTVPIQPTDRDKVKWQQFMDDCRRLHLIPLVRITTIPQGGTWAEGEATDLVDFANFLNGLSWPVQNRYIVLFNEVNRAAEWGGTVDPATYDKIVENASKIFKERSADFFLLGPALDDALPNSASSLSAVRYLQEMSVADPYVWTYLDGWAAHSYPNPGFAAAPRAGAYPGVTSYKTEMGLLRLADKPIFVTETGWDQTQVTGLRLASYWATAWKLWNSDPNVVAVTPFVLSGGDQFRALSLTRADGAWSESGNDLLGLAKSAGAPLVNTAPAPAPASANTEVSPSWSSPFFKASRALIKVENIFRLIFGLPQVGTITLGSNTLQVEIAATPKQWEQGLSGRATLDATAGMLFRFPEVHVPVFWMKDMRFPLDMIWIDNDTVVDITANVPAPTSPTLPTYSPKQEVDTVLEVNAGYAENHKIKLGDTLKFSN